MTVVHIGGVRAWTVAGYVVDFGGEIVPVLARGLFVTRTLARDEAIAVGCPATDDLVLMDSLFVDGGLIAVVGLFVVFEGIFEVAG